MEPQAFPIIYKLRLLCSFNGRIMPIPPGNSLHYIGGETRLVLVPRGISFPALFDLLSGKLLNGRSFSIKYRLPGADLDTLITVSDTDDLQNMIAEHDSSHARHIRLFLFPLNHPEPHLSGEEKLNNEEAPTTSASIPSPENTAFSGKETESQEPLTKQRLLLCYVPVLTIEPPTLTHQLPAGPLSPVNET